MAKVGDILVALIRCGRTDWDDQGRMQGRTDLPLSESGHQAAEALTTEIVRQFAGEAAAGVYMGPDEASRQTGEMIAEFARATPKTIPGLAPPDLGIWEGLLDAQMEERFPSAFRQWRSDPATVHPPEGEPFEDADQRLREAMCRVMEKANGKPLLFVLRPLAFGAAACWLTGRPTEDLWQVLDDGPQILRLAVPRDTVRAAKEGSRAPT